MITDEMKKYHFGDVYRDVPSHELPSLAGIDDRLELLRSWGHNPRGLRLGDFEHAAAIVGDRRPHGPPMPLLIIFHYQPTNKSQVYDVVEMLVRGPLVHAINMLHLTEPETTVT